MAITMRKEWAYVMEIGNLILISHFIYFDVNMTPKAS